MTLGQLLAQDPRPVGQVLIDAVRDADAILSDARARVSVDGETTAQDMARFIEALERAAKLAKVAIDAGVMQAVVAQRERDAEREGWLLADVLTSVLDTLLLHTVDDPGQRAEWMAWARAAAQAKLEAMGGRASVGPPPVPVRAIEGHVVDPAVARVLEAEAAALLE